MKESSSLASMTLEVDKNKQEMLRGYDPLNEIACWGTIISCLGFELASMGFFFLQLMTVADPSSSTSTNSFSALMIALIAIVWLLVGIGLPFLFFQGYRQNQRQRKTLRQAALRAAFLNEPRELVILPSPTFSEHFSLPVLIESRVKRNSRLVASIGTVLCCLFLCLGSILNINIMTLSVWLSLLADLMLMIALFSGIWMVRMILYQTASYYLLPSLRVNNDGILARYGHTTITIRWSDIRHFALVNNIQMIANNKKFDGDYKCNEVFEISDGENIICWQAASSLRSYNLRLAGEVALSPKDYNVFAQQFAALIGERTGLPLYDFRPPERKAKQRKRKKQLQAKS